MPPRRCGPPTCSRLGRLGISVPAGGCEGSAAFLSKQGPDGGGQMGGCVQTSGKGLVWPPGSPQAGCMGAARGRALAGLGGLGQRVGRGRTISLSFPFCPRFLLPLPLSWDPLFISGSAPVSGGWGLASPALLPGALTPLPCRALETGFLRRHYRLSCPPRPGAE